MRPFYLYKSKRGIYYVQFSNEKTHERLTALSTKQRNYNDALKVACEWLKDGIPSREGARSVGMVSTVQSFVALLESGELGSSELDRIARALSQHGFDMSKNHQKKVHSVESVKTPLVKFLENFWTYETSPYVQDKLIHKQRIGKQHCYTSRQWLPHWKEFFTDSKYLEDVTTEDLKVFERFLAKKNLATASLNHILIIGKTAFKWAVANSLLDKDPSIGLTRYGKEIPERGILTNTEAKQIFEIKWLDERARVAILVAMTCGLRISEILALQVCDVGESRLYVTHSWSSFDGLKCPKNGEMREVPLLPFVKGELLKLARSNPFGSDPERFIFYGNLSDRPIVINVPGCRNRFLYDCNPATIPCCRNFSKY